MLLSRAVINPVNELDVIYNVPYVISSMESYNKAYISATNDMLSYAKIIELNLGLSSEAAIKYASLFVGKAIVNYNNILDIITNVIQPPLTDHIIEVEKDAFTRQSYPTMNYGNRHTLLSGLDYDGEYITYLGFDLSNLYSLTDKSLRNIYFTIQKELGTSGRVKVYECKDDWFENYIVWQHKMQLSSEPLLDIEVDSNVKTIVEDIKDLILQKMQEGKTKLSLAIKSEGFVIFNARESGAGAKIIVQYSDPNWWGYVDKIDMYNKAIIRKLENKDYKGAALVTKRLLKLGKAYIDRRENLKSKASLVNAQVASRANIVLSIYGENKGTVRSRKQLSGKAFIPNASLTGGGTVVSATFLTSKSYINPESDSKAIKGRAGIIKKYLESIMRITHLRDIVSKSMIRSLEIADITSRAVILNNIQLGKADIQKIHNLLSRANISSGHSLPSFAVIEGEVFDIQNKTIIGKTVDLLSKAIVVGVEEIPSKSDVTNFINLGRGYIQKVNDLYSRSDIYGGEDAESKAFLTKFFQIDSRGKIRQFDQVDLVSRATVSAYLDLLGNQAAIVRSSINSIAYILQPRVWRPNLEGGLIFEDRRYPRQWSQ